VTTCMPYLIRSSDTVADLASRTLQDLLGRQVVRGRCGQGGGQRCGTEPVEPSGLPSRLLIRHLGVVPRGRV
jgi:hypothetical protein